MLAEHPAISENHFEIVSIQNACVESVLMSVRDLDDFFAPRTNKTHDSDVRASDFHGYVSPGRFLSDPQRDSINQWIAHLTYQPVWTNTTGIAPDTSRNWNTTEFVGKAARSVIMFLNYLECNLSRENSDMVNDIQKVKRTLDLMLKNMDNLAMLESEQSVQ